MAWHGCSGGGSLQYGLRPGAMLPLAGVAPLVVCVEQRMCCTPPRPHRLPPACSLPPLQLRLLHSSATCTAGRTGLACVPTARSNRRLASQPAVSPALPEG